MSTTSVVDRATISDVLRLAGVAAIQHGERVWFRSPVHDDTEPSAIVVGKRGWRCFSCRGKGGILDLAIAFGLAHSRRRCSLLRSEVAVMNEDEALAEDLRHQVVTAPSNGEPAQRPSSNGAQATPQPHVVAQFIHQNPDGTAFARVDRLEPGFDPGKTKGFLPYLALPGGGFATEVGLNGEALPLYRLPELLAAGKARHEGFGVEGQGKADRLRKALHADGLVAAVTSFGSSSMRLTDEQIAAFEGMPRVTVFADSDGTGRVAARENAERIARAYPECVVKVIDLFPDRDDGSDVEDWLDDGSSPHELLALVEVAERVAPIDWGDIYPWPEPMRDEAFYGIAGEFVNFIASHTESDRHAILADFLCGVSAMIGSNPHTAGVSRQQARINALVIGETGDGRKGNAFYDACRVLSLADSQTLDAILAPGVASGEGLINFLRTEKDENGTPRLKRAWVREDEYTRLSAAAQRDGSTLSQCLRGAFDGVLLANITKKDPVRVKGSHVAISADVTPADLRQDTTETKIANGVVNRFAMVCSKRTKLLPFGGDLPDADLEPIAKRLDQAIRHARDRDAVQLSEAAKPVWKEFYCANETAEHPPLLSAATRRGAQFVLRVALIFALLEMADEIEPGHLRAAIAWWDYCFASARYVFGARLGNPRADALVEHLRNLHPEKLTSADVDAFFGKNLSASSRQSIRADVVNRGLVSIEKVPSQGKAGRPADLWAAVPPKHSSPPQATEETDNPTDAAI
jgi:hypothetical protein